MRTTWLGTTSTHALVAAGGRAVSVAVSMIGRERLADDDRDSLTAAIRDYRAAESVWNHTREGSDTEADYPAALNRLIVIARRDTHQSRRVANYLLAWWNADVHGGWDITDLWNVDAAIAADMMTCLRAVHAGPQGVYPYERRTDFETIMARHRGIDLEAAYGRL